MPFQNGRVDRSAIVYIHFTALTGSGPGAGAVGPGLSLIQVIVCPTVEDGPK